MKKIALTQGFTAKVDDDDFEWLSKNCWMASPTQRNTKYCAAREGNKSDSERRGKTIFMHREILNANSEQEVDHIDRDPLNNQRNNLRLCTSQQNSCNRAKCIGSISKFKGVYKRIETEKWRAQIRVFGKLISLGEYSTPIEAAMIYDAAAVYCFREFACINFDEHKKDYLKQSEELDNKEETDEC